MPLSEFELDEVANEALIVTVSSPPVRGLEVGKNDRARDWIPGRSITARPGREGTVNGSDAGHRSPGRWGILRNPAVMFFHRVHGLLRAGAEQCFKPVQVGLAHGPCDLRASVQLLTAALHLPTVDPNRQAHEAKSGFKREAGRIIPLLPRWGAWAIEWLPEGLW